MQRSQDLSVNFFIISYSPLGTVQELEFTQAQYEVSINETSIPLEASFLTVLCNFSVNSNSSDNTTESNAVEYMLMAGGDIPFTVNLTTGELMVSNDLDYENTRQYNFTAICAFGSDLSLNSTAGVTVNILPVNEHRPSIKSMNMHTIVTEFTSPGLLNSTLPGIAYVVSDADEPPDTIYYTLRESDQSEVGIVFNETQKGIVLTEPYDRESQNSTNCNVILLFFRVTVCDISPPDENCPNILLSISFHPSNDNTPQFSQDVYVTTLEENTAANTTLDVVVNCTDEDVCDGQLDGMEITDTDLANLFSINNDGEIASLQPLDYEQRRSYNLTVRCFDTDTNIPPVERETFTTVRIDITDENDNPPVCSKPEMVTLEVGEYERISLLHLSCTDDDEGINRELTFQADGELPQVTNGQFTLDETTGELQFSGELASSAEYDFHIAVSDSGLSPLTTTVPVSIKVITPSTTAPLTDPPTVVPMLLIIVVCVVGGLLLVFCLLVLLLCCCCCCCCFCCRKTHVEKKL